jgi:hypothetical protein
MHVSEFIGCFLSLAIFVVMVLGYTDVIPWPPSRWGRRD